MNKTIVFCLFLSSNFAGAKLCSSLFKDPLATFVLAESKEELLVANERIIEALARNAGYQLSRELSFEGVISELQTKLIEVFEEYNPNKGPFSPWAHGSIKFKIIDLKRKYLNKVFTRQKATLFNFINEYSNRNEPNLTPSNIELAYRMDHGKWPEANEPISVNPETIKNINEILSSDHKNEFQIDTKRDSIQAKTESTNILDFNEHPELERAFNKLSPLEQDVVKLSVIEALHDKEIAESLNITKSAAMRVRLSAFDKLKTELTNSLGIVPLENTKTLPTPKRQKALMYLCSLDRSIVLDTMENLTPREKQVIPMLMDGRTGNMIASELGVHETLISHVKREGLKKIFKNLLDKNVGDKETIEGFLKRK